VVAEVQVVVVGVDEFHAAWRGKAREMGARSKVKS